MTTNNPLGIYIHWPYCTRLCPYCDFNIYRQRGKDEALFLALLEDINWWANEIIPRPLTSLSFGGGTPSLLAPEQIAQVIDLCSNKFGFIENPEIGMETNPTDAEAGKLQGFADAGINRLSLGIQSFDDEVLKFLGRNHNAKEARRAIEKAQAIFDNTSFDLIYATPEQTEKKWRRELETALSFNTPHISLYQLTVEPGTAFEKAVKRKQWSPLPDEKEATLYDMAQEICAKAGLRGYEISNLAKPGYESKHNKLYWQSHDFIGIGPGAHSRVTKGGQRMAAETIPHPRAYAEELPPQRFFMEALTREDQTTEFLLMGLRLKQGIDLARYKHIAGKDLPAKPRDLLIKDGLAEMKDNHFALTAKGRLLLNTIVLELMD
jgi:putative oxygen-independent coproporphyrinogen III oxidase